MVTARPEGDTPENRDAPSPDRADPESAPVESAPIETASVEATPVSDLEALLARDPDSEEAWLRIAAIARDPDLARAIYQRILGKDPHSLRAQQALAALDHPPAAAAPDDTPGDVPDRAPGGTVVDGLEEGTHPATPPLAIVPARDAPEPPMTAAPTESSGLKPIEPLKPTRRVAWPGLRILHGSTVLALLLFVLLGIVASVLLHHGADGADPLGLVMSSWGASDSTPAPPPSPVALTATPVAAAVGDPQTPSVTPTHTPAPTASPTATVTPTVSATAMDSLPPPTADEPTSTPEATVTDEPTPEATVTDEPTPGVTTPTPAVDSSLVLSEEVIPSWATERYLPLPLDERWIEVNLTTQELIAYEGLQPVFSTIISSGKANTPTIVGKFRIQLKYVSQLMIGPGYYLPDVPWLMYFYGNYAIHAAYWHTNWGTPMSHGCVNMPVDDAEWLFHWTDPVMPEGQRTVLSSEDNPGTWVLIHK